MLGYVLCVDTTLVYSLSRGWKKLIKKQPVTKEKIRKTFRNPGKPLFKTTQKLQEILALC